MLCTRRRRGCRPLPTCTRIPIGPHPANNILVLTVPADRDGAWRVGRRQHSMAR